MQCSHPGCQRRADHVLELCDEHWPKCLYCQQRAAFARMARPECTNCWEVRHRLDQFLSSSINLQLVKQKIKAREAI